MKMVMWKHKLYKEMNTLDYLNYSKANISVWQKVFSYFSSEVKVALAMKEQQIWLLNCGYPEFLRNYFLTPRVAGRVMRNRVSPSLHPVIPSCPSVLLSRCLLRIVSLVFECCKKPTWSCVWQNLIFHIKCVPQTL